MLHHFTFSNSTNIRRSRDAGLCIGNCEPAVRSCRRHFLGSGTSEGFRRCGSCADFDLAAVIPGYVRKRLVWD